MSDQGGVLPGLWPIHGEGVLARQGDLVLLVHPAGGAFTDRLLDLLARTARTGQGGTSFADLVSAECAANEAEAASAPASAAGDDEGPAAVAFGPVASGTAFTVYGTAWAEVTTARGVQRLGTGEPYGRLTYILKSTVIKVRAGVRPATSVGDTDPYLRLADGVVRAVAFVYAPAEVPPGTEAPAAPPIAAQAAAPAPPAPMAPAPEQVATPEQASEQAPEPATEPAPEEFPAGAEPPGDAAPPIGEVVADLVAGGAAAGGAAAAGVGAAAGLSATSLDAAWPDQDLGSRPAPLDPSQDPMHSPTSLDAAWGNQVAPPGPAPVDSDYDDQAAQAQAQAAQAQAAQAQEPVHSPTSLDVSWRDQAPPPGPAPVDPGFGEPGAPFGAGGDPYGQAAYPYGEAPAPGPADFGGDFVALPLGGQPAEEMPRRDPLPLGAEPLGDQAISPGEGLAPIVMGIYCKNGHFDDPEARYCAVCGIGMAQLTKVPQEGRRPPLGVLVLDDGSVCQLDTDYVVGREPTLDQAVAEGRARPLRLGGAPDLVSRIHARVELEGWQVYVSDLNSANGTLLVLPGETTGTKLAPGVRTPLVAGSQIRLGDAYALRYDSHRHR